MRIVGSKQRRVQLFRDIQQTVGHLLFDLQTVVHEFDIEIVASENILQFPCGTQCFVELAEQQSRLDDS